jgi:uncharacterized repeat protein (TIGR02543 family)
MKKFLCLLCLCFCLFINRAFSADFYVSLTGNDANDGSIVNPFRTLQHAINLIAPGDVIYMRGGLYAETATISIARGNNGTAAAAKEIIAYNNEEVILNFAAQTEVSTNRGLSINGHYWHVKGLIVEQAGDNGIFIGGNNNTIEKCITRRNRDTGLQLGRYSSTATSVDWPSNNLIVDCESYDNKDVANENADGFACKLTTGPGNIFRRCVSHNNIDDGWDLYTKTDTGPIGAVTLEDCIAHSNGTLTTGGTSGNGDKNGFKLGGEGIPVNHIVRRCVAFNNGKHGFTYNSNPGSIEMTNNTAYRNAQRNFSFDAGTHVYKNNLSYLPASNDKVIGNTSFPNAFSNDQSWGFTVNAADFISLTPGSNANPLASGFLNLAPGSDLINAGVITSGISYSGSLPDLGAIESGGVITPPPATTYTLSIAANPSGGGSIVKSPDQTSYDPGTIVTLTATPASGYTFNNWSGGATGNSTTTTVTMNANTSVTANFTSTVTAGGTATLRIDNTATAATGLCSFDGSFRLIGSTNVINLSNSAGRGITWKVAVPAPGNYELKWRYAGGGSTAATTAKLLVNGVTVFPSVSFPGTSSTSFLITTPVVAALGNGVNEIRIETTAAAAFADIEYIEIKGESPQATNCANAIGSGGGSTNQYTVTTSSTPAAGGTVTLTPSLATYAQGASVMLTANAASGYQFTGWSGNATGNVNPLTITVDGNKNIVAQFTAVAVNYTLTTNVNGQGTVTPLGGSFASGQPVQITASPASGWQFSNWTGDASGSTNPLTVTMNSNKTVTAVFTEAAIVQNTLRIEDAATPSNGYCSVDGDYETEHEGADNGAYLNTTNAIGKGINWRVNAPAAGTYLLKWRFANLSGNRNARILINGIEAVALVPFAPTGDWAIWTFTSDVAVNLEAGANTIRLEATTADGLANIDWMEITGNQPTAALCDNAPADTYVLTTSVVGQGTITPSGSYATGTPVSVAATPATGWQFVGWSGAATGNTNPLTVLMDGNKNITAIFSDGSITQANNAMVGYATVNGEGLASTTGGQGGGACITISTLAQLQAWALSRENNTTPQIVYISGKISAPSTTVVTIKNGANLSVYGLGTTGELQNVGLNFRDYKNVIIRNMKIHEVFYPNDALTIDACQHVWVDHCELYSKIGAGISVDTYDGLLDIKNGSRYVTVSWNHFHDHMKDMLIGHTDNANAEATDREIRVTIHHNFFENTDGRNPSLRWGAVHLYNNYFKNITDYGIAVRQGAHALIENNVYENVRLPISTNKFDGEGFACLNGNLFTGTSGANSITQTGCDWWTSTILPYSYTLDPVSSITTLVPGNVGIGKISFTGCDGITPPTGNYTLTVVSNPVAGGSITKSPDLTSYPAGTVVTLTAGVATGYNFTNWSGGASGTNLSTTITMNANATVTANFTPVIIVPPGGGNSLQIFAIATPATGLCAFDGSLRTVGSSSVLNFSNTAGKGATYKVLVPAAGSYTLTWRYAGGGSTAQETARLLVNGVTVNAAVPFPKPANSTSFLITAPQQVNLIAGVNEIRIEAVISAALGDVEYMEVNGNNPQAANCSTPIGGGLVIPVTVSCPSSREVNTDPGTCTAVINNLDPVVSPATETFNYLMSGATTGSGAGSVSGKTFGKGVTTVSYTSTTDPTKSCSFTITVKDATPPVITCNATIERNTDAGQCAALIEVAAPDASDLCGQVNVNGTRSDNLPLNAAYPLGTTTITWTAVDAAGNPASCEQTIIVKDNQKPMITCNATVERNADEGQCSALISIVPPVASDLCGEATVNGTRSDNLALDASYPVGTTIITWTATDAAGNQSSCEQLIIVKDATAPVINCNPTVERNADEGQCSASVVITPPLATDNCGTATVSGVRSDNLPLNSSYPVGTTVITWTAVDGAGNHSGCEQSVIVTDNQNPVITCPATQTFCAVNNNSYSIPVLVSTDNCGVGTVSYSITGATTRSGAGADASGNFQKGTSIITWTVTDIHGNQAQCSTMVKVNSLPTVTIPDAMAMNAGVTSNTVYIGYTPASAITLAAQSPGAGIQYQWSNGISGQSITVSPSVSTSYSVTATNAYGCTSIAEKYIQVRDVRCGNNNDKVSLCKPGANSICVSANAVQAQVNGGAFLGDCQVLTTRAPIGKPEIENAGMTLNVLPNPSSQGFEVKLNLKGDNKAEFIVRDISGRIIEKRNIQSSQTLKIGGTYSSGMYFAELVQGNERITLKLIKL